MSTASDQATLFVGISQLLLPHKDEGSTKSPVHLVEDGALLVKDGIILASGSRQEAEANKYHPHAKLVDLGGRAVIPGLVDSHTHIVFGGERLDEFSRRSRGETYEEIAAAGGGIQSSRATLKSTSAEDLFKGAEERLEVLLSGGVTTVEIKSGYGLEPKLELLQLEIIDELKRNAPQDIRPTLLAHVIPKDWEGSREDYIQQFITDVIEPAVQEELADYFDVFIETGAFSPDEARQLIEAGKDRELKVKLHVDQLTCGKGAQLAAEVGALSADHLEYIDAEGRAALGEAGVVATLLPGCTLFLGKGPWVDGRALRDAGVEVAVSTDANPGSSMILDLPLCGTLAATQCGLSLEEALWGVTRGGAKALDLDDRGTLRTGERADFVVLDHTDWRSIFYRVAAAPIGTIYIGGRAIWFKEPS